MDDSPAPRRSIFAVWHWARWKWFVVTLLMLAGYVLSIGPAERLDNDGYIFGALRDFLIIFYWPVATACELYPPFSDAMDLYLGWWADS